MKVVIAVDSFKGSLSSYEAGVSISNGVKKVYPDSEIIITPIADGGEGTVDALVKGLNGKMESAVVSNPLGEKITASYGIVKGDTAIIEMSQAAGITLILKEQLNPLKTTTFGVGELILDAISKGCKNFIIGIGGSATNDGGVGMLQALGFEFLDEFGNPAKYGCEGVSKIKTIKDDNALPILKELNFSIACDVTNPLCGENGCSHVYSKQKGAKDSDIPKMDKYLSSFADLTKKLYPDSDKDHAGAGAAGGLGFAFLSYLNGKLTPGINLILELINFDSSLKNADLVITGEGRTDAQTAMGKTAMGIANVAKKYNIPVIALSGSASYDSNVLNKLGVCGIFPILRSVLTLEEAMNKETASKNAEATAEQVMNFYKTIKG